VLDMKLLLLLLLFPNLKSPFSFCPNWEADVLRERVPVVEEEKVGLLDLDVEEVMVVWTEWTIAPYRTREQHERRRGGGRR
jgi:hypothetical protein